MKMASTLEIQLKQKLYALDYGVTVVKVRVRVRIAWRGIFHYHLLTASQFFSDYLCIYRVLCGANS